MKACNDQLEWVDHPLPTLASGEVLVRVAATAINRADLVQRSGNYPPPPGASPILGLECSGWVESLGPEVVGWKVGDPCCALLSGGGYAEFVAVPYQQLLPIPSGLNLVQAAAIPEVFTTAWLNLRQEGQLVNSERVVLHAGASGVGTAAIQLCREWNNPVAVTLSGQRKADFCRDLGAELALDRQQGPWLEAVLAWGGADVILDPVGADYLEANLQALNPRGRLINIGLMGGRQANFPMGTLLMKRLTVRGSVLRSRSVLEKAEVLKGVLQEVWPLFESGRLQPIIECEMPIEQALQAHQQVASNQTVGKVVLKVHD